MILLTFWTHDGYFRCERLESVLLARKSVQGAARLAGACYNDYYISVLGAEIEVQGCSTSELL